MADASVTLTQSQNSSSSGVTYRGYVIDSCNNSKVDNGSWSPTYTATGVNFSINSNKITVWNTNTSTSDKSATFTWTSSAVSGCSKTLSVTAKGKPATTTVYCAINLSCTLQYEDSSCNGYGSSTDADFEVQCDNYTELYWIDNYAAMPGDLSTTMDLGYKTIEYTDITPLSGVIEVSLPGYFMTSTSSIRISFGGDATGSKTFYGARDNCVDYGDNPIGGYYYTFDAGLSASGYFNSTTITSIKIKNNIYKINGSQNLYLRAIIYIVMLL